MPPKTGRKRERGSKQRASEPEEETSPPYNNGLKADVKHPAKRCRLNDESEKDAMTCSVSDMEIDEDASNPLLSQAPTPVSTWHLLYNTQGIASSFSACGRRV